MNHKIKALVAAAGMLCGSSAMAAQVISFDPDGAGGTGAISVGAFDWAPGSTLAQNSIAGPGMVNPTFQVYTQAKLGAFLDGNGNAMASPAGFNTNYEITYVGAFGEAGSSPVAGIAAFTGIAAGYVNYFSIYWDNNPGTFANALAGTGYSDGTQILSGAWVASNGGYFVNLSAAPVALDQFNANDWAGTSTLTGSGGTSMDVDVAWTDGNFFKSDIVSLIVDSMFNTSNVTPFNQTDPSQLVVGVAPNIGAVNGATGPDFLFQTDANQSFNTTVPEPALAALLGMGMIGFAAARRKTKA